MGDDVDRRCLPGIRGLLTTLAVAIGVLVPLAAAAQPARPGRPGNAGNAHHSDQREPGSFQEAEPR